MSAFVSRISVRLSGTSPDDINLKVWEVAKALEKSLDRAISVGETVIERDLDAYHGEFEARDWKGRAVMFPNIALDTMTPETLPVGHTTIAPMDHSRNVEVKVPEHAHPTE